MCARLVGGGVTPERVIQLLKDEVARTSQAATARATGLTLRGVQNYLKGIGEPTTATVQKLANYFGVSVAWLRGESDDGPIPPETINSRADKVITELNEIAAIHELTPDNLRNTFRLMFFYWQSETEKVVKWLVIGNLAEKKVQEITDLWNKVDRAVYYNVES